MVRVKSEQRKQKIPQGSYPQKEAVNTLGYEEVPSSPTIQTSKQVRAGKHINLMEQVLEKENMKKALYRVKQNKGAPGVDGVTVENLIPYIKETWHKTKAKLLNGTYKPLPVRRFEVPKPGGGVRLLGIPTVQDRLIQQAVLQILTPLIDPTFSPFSYGFRPGRSAHQAVKQAQIYINEGYRYVVDTDLEKFFDSVNHDILMSKLAKQIKDKAILRLIRRYLRAGIMVNGCCFTSEEGTPQGGPLSPLLANIMLHELDEELTKRGHRFVRYADDCNVYVKSKRAGIRVMQSVTKFVEQRLKLKVNKEKSASDRPWKRKLLGFSVTREKVCRLRLAPKTLERFKNKIRQLTRRSWGQSMATRLERLNTHLKGWIGYFHLAQTRSVIEHLDKWIRRRLRACLLKQWKRGKTKQRNLVALGLESDWAAKISWSRKKSTGGYLQLNKYIKPLVWPTGKNKGLKA